MTAIALSLQVPDAELGNAPLPHMLDWMVMVGREEAGDHKAKVELWPHRQAFSMLSGHPG